MALAVTAVRLQYYDPRAGQRGSDKFYDTITYQVGSESILIKRWGRVGTEGQSQLTKFQNWSACQVAAQEIREQKLHKGYRTTAMQEFEYIGSDTMRGLLSWTDRQLESGAVASAVNEYRNQERYGVTTLIEEDPFA